MQWSNRDKIGDPIAGCLEEDQRPVAMLTTHASEVLPRLSPSEEVVAFPKLKLNAATWSRGTPKVINDPSPLWPFPASPGDGITSYRLLEDNDLAWFVTSRRAWSANMAKRDGGLGLGAPKAPLGGNPLKKRTRIVAIDAPRERLLVVMAADSEDELGMIFVRGWRAQAVGSNSAQEKAEPKQTTTPESRDPGVLRIAGVRYARRPHGLQNERTLATSSMRAVFWHYFRLAA